MRLPRLVEPQSRFLGDDQIRPYKVKFAILRLTSLHNTKPTGMREGHKIETINFFK